MTPVVTAAAAVSAATTATAPRSRARRRRRTVPSGADDDDDDEEEDAPPPPTWRQLYAHGLQQAVPFTGFGIMDNAIMIVAGDYIDLKLGVMLGISTMCAAGFGNIISTSRASGSARVIESFAERLWPAPRRS